MAARRWSRQAVEQVIVEYEELPSVTTIDDATRAGAVQLWGDAPGNVSAQTEFGKKDATDAAFASRNLRTATSSLSSIARLYATRASGARPARASR